MTTIGHTTNSELVQCEIQEPVCPFWNGRTYEMYRVDSGNGTFLYCFYLHKQQNYYSNYFLVKYKKKINL